MSQTCFDGVDRFFYHQQQQQPQQQPQQTDLPVLGVKALEQILFETQQASQIAPCTPEMERMSPDSSMDWAQNGDKMISTPTSSPSSSTSTLPLPQPDSTTSDSVAYDSDAFNSDDSNDSCAEMQLNAHLINNQGYILNQQSVEQPQNEEEDKSNNNFLEKLSSKCEEVVKEKKKKKKGKRAGNVLLQCHLCEYSTRFKEHLTSHMNTHTNTRKRASS